jgi:dihydrofolate reductase
LTQVTLIAQRNQLKGWGMQPVRYSINITLDGCYDHRAMLPDAELHHHATELIAQADALIFGRTVYQLMEAAWRPLMEGQPRPDWVADWMMPFAQTIHAAKKYVVSNTLQQTDWNTEIIRGDHLEATVRDLRQQTGNGLLIGGVMLPLALAKLDLIDEYEFVVHPRIAGHGPTLFAGLANPVDLKLVDRREFGGGAVALRYQPTR